MDLTVLADELLTLLGKRTDDPAVHAALVGLGFDQPPKLPSAEYAAYLSSPAEGFSLAFINEAMLTKSCRGSLVLRGVHFYTDGQDKFSGFAGALPLGLALDSSRAELVAQLGESSTRRVRHEVVRSERWDLDGCSVHATYKNASDRIAVLYVGLREA